MQVTPATAVGSERSLTATARRSQIVDSAIETIAELGYGQASFARIAERAGLSSTRLISYHFAGKSELIEQIVLETYAAMGEFMAPRMEAASSSLGLLEAYIVGVVEFMVAYPTKMKALLGIFLDFRTDDGGRSYDENTEQSTTSRLEDILRSGQASGEFRQFDTYVMAVTVQRAVDGLPFLLEGRPDLDLRAYARELVVLFDHATRKES
jgi:AcrR family transcriptional regulator